MLGYYKREEDTEDVIQIHSDGLRWLHTGDLGYMDENGILFVTGRIKRIFMTKGKDKQVTKIFPDRIEKVIDTHPSVELSCVVGVQDVERIHYPKAFVVLKEHEKRAFVITEEILELCRKNLPEYMVPDKIEFREELPRTERGKVDYRKLEELADK